MKTMHSKFAATMGKSLVLGGLVLAAGCASLPEYEPVTPGQAQAGQADIQAVGLTAATSASLAAARQRVQDARDLGIQASEAERFLAAAEAAAAENDDARTSDLAGRAHRHADIAINQHYVADAEAELAEAREYANLSKEQHQRLAAGEEALAGQRAEEALQILQALNAELAVAQSIYTVVSGDSLWKISAKDEVYGNPYWWPLIYKNNADQIRDPDLLEIGQDLNIRVNPTITEVNTAVDHAHTRGAWTVGGVEEADGRYLNR
jgi:nucleoid-associated protein YgaU